MPLVDPVKTRQLAVEIVTRLREAGFEALWAGGCVRDMLMGRQPKDYDVATNAWPEQVREIFGRRKTLAIGASFGVIAVLGPPGSGQIDVATFRQDTSYSDGRRPDSVTYCNAEQDALRRDFTINGLFFDPIQRQVIDYVGGQGDLESRVIRAIGEADQRFAEDKLRVLRAIRFAATLEFEIEAVTFSALGRFAPTIHAVSAERITEELRKTLLPVDPPATAPDALFIDPLASAKLRVRGTTGARRRRGLELLREGKLLVQLLPHAEHVFADERSVDELAADAWKRTLSITEVLDTDSYGVAIAALVREIVRAGHMDQDAVARLCRHWRMSNDDSEVVLSCLANESAVRLASRTYWPDLQRLLIDPRIGHILEYAEAVARVLDDGLAEIEFCRERLRWPAEWLNPPPLITGDDLRLEAIPQGPLYRELLHAVRDSQLLGQLATREEALAWVRAKVKG